MNLMRLDKERNINKSVNRISFEHDGEEYTITPDHFGFRVHKHNLAGAGITIIPSCNNEIIIK